MTKEELEKRAKEYARKEVYYGAYVDEEVGMEIAEEAYIEATERETKLLQKRIAELEAQIAELEKENAELKQINSETLTQLNLDNGELIIENEKLKKENAELKEKVNILDNCDRLGDVITEAYKDQLTKAKEIIKSFQNLQIMRLSMTPNTHKNIQTYGMNFVKKQSNS